MENIKIKTSLWTNYLYPLSHTLKAATFNHWSDRQVKNVGLI